VEAIGCEFMADPGTSESKGKVDCHAGRGGPSAGSIV
jgi:hypothetical protein